VFRVYTGAHPAEVIEKQSLWDRPMSSFVGESVSVFITITVPEFAVAILIARAKPDDAAAWIGGDIPSKPNIWIVRVVC